MGIQPDVVDFVDRPTMAIFEGEYAGAMPIALPLHRSYLGGAFAEAGYTRGAEIGVWEGGFAEKLCQPNPGLKLICVDPWKSQPDYKEGKNEPARMEQAYHTALARLAPFDCTFLKMTSVEAARHVPDGSLDFIYLDANHLVAHVQSDLELWVPKVRQGGVVAGHDYTGKPKSFIQVKPAVDAYTRSRGITKWFLLSADKSGSFLWVVT